MLKELLVENIALIEKANIDFNDGFNVLTGETGAGKSLVIDAINAITGERTSRDLIRTGSSNASVTAVFTNICDRAKEILSEFGIELEDNLIIKKTINEKRSTIRICGQPATAAMVKQLACELINIHGQHDSQALLNPDTHCSFIDSVAQNDKELAAYKEEFNTLRSIKRELDSLDMDEDKKRRERDLYEYQLKELDALDIKPGEQQALKDEFALIQSSDDVRKKLSSAISLLKGDSGADGIVNLASIAVHELNSKGMEQYNNIAEKLVAAQFSLEAVLDELVAESEKCNFDAERIKYVSDRLHEVNRAIHKYGGTEEELFKFYNTAKAALEKIDNTDEIAHRLENELSESEERLIKKARLLTASRKSAAERFSRDVCTALDCLDMPNVKFFVNVEQGRYTKSGCDNVEFMISANVGEPPKPIVKIASGGELSRIMLAIKSVLAKIDGVDTLIFDEIDIGISGKAAEKVAIKLREVASYRQVLCVTHLAQIACAANTHLLIEKRADGERTVTNIYPLDYNGRVNEIARIIAGNTITESVINTAREMLDRRI